MTKEIIGVIHKPSLRDKVIGYIDDTHQNFDSIMIELPPDWHGSDGGFFEPIARHYQERGKRVIPGDAKYWTAVEAPERYTASKIGGYIDDKEIRVRFNILMGFFDGRLIRDRNVAMNAVFQKEKPDIVLVGARHAKYLKRGNKEIPFTYISGGRYSQRLISLDIEMAADRIVRLSDPADREAERRLSRLIEVWTSGYSVLGGLAIGYMDGCGIQHPADLTTLIGTTAGIGGLASGIRIGSDAFSRGEGYPVSQGVGGFLGKGISESLIASASYCAGNLLGKLIH